MQKSWGDCIFHNGHLLSWYARHRQYTSHTWKFLKITFDQAKASRRTVCSHPGRWKIQGKRWTRHHTAGFENIHDIDIKVIFLVRGMFVHDAMGSKGSTAFIWNWGYPDSGILPLDDDVPDLSKLQTHNHRRWSGILLSDNILQLSAFLGGPSRFEFCEPISLLVCLIVKWFSVGLNFNLIYGLNWENCMAIFTTRSVVIWFSTGTLGIFATLVYVFTMRVVIHNILSMAIITTLSASILFCNFYYILLWTSPRSVVKIAIRI